MHNVIYSTYIMYLANNIWRVICSGITVRIVGAGVDIVTCCRTTRMYVCNWLVGLLLNCVMRFSPLERVLRVLMSIVVAGVAVSWIEVIGDLAICLLGGNTCSSLWSCNKVESLARRIADWPSINGELGAMYNISVQTIRYARGRCQRINVYSIEISE